MKFKKEIQIMSIIICLLALIASVIGVFTGFAGGDVTHYESIHGVEVEIYGRGIYQYDSVSVATQAIAQDIITLIFAIPLLLISLVMFRKNSFTGKLLLTGTIGYFLYTYASYAFLSMYNSLFLVFVLLFSLSFFAFTLLMMSFDMDKIKSRFKQKLPTTFIGSILIFTSVMLLLMWLGRIGPPLMNQEYPDILEHYTTLVIQVLDLGFIVPVSFLAGILIIKQKSWGYLLAPVFIIKAITLLSAITMMMIMLIQSGQVLSVAEIFIFPIFDIVIIISLIYILKNINNNEERVSL